MKVSNCQQAQRIRLYHRGSGRTETEKVCGRRWMDLFYGTGWGRWLTRRCLCRPAISKIYGRLQQHPRTRTKIPEFVDQYGIDLSEAMVPPGGFACFNDFFIRRLKPEARPINSDPDCLTAPADSRLLAVALGQDSRIRVKGMHWRLSQLLGTAALDDRFGQGLCLNFRLAPCDYHRFGFAANGVQGPVHTCPGPLHSVNPLALQHKQDILATNFRQWCLIHSQRFGTLIQVEVGALMVGSIVQHQPRGGACRKGAEKGYFQFGGSTVLLIFEPGRLAVDPDIRHYSDQGIETRVRYGEAVGRALDRGA